MYMYIYGYIYIYIYMYRWRAALRRPGADVPATPARRRESASGFDPQPPPPAGIARGIISYDTIL